MTEILGEKELKEVAYHMLELAKFNLAKHGCVEPVGFLFTEDGMKGAILRFEDNESKDACLRRFKELAVEYKAYAIMLITEGWVAKITDPKQVALADEIGVEFMPGRMEQINVSISAPYFRVCIGQEIDTSIKDAPRVIGEPIEMDAEIHGRLFDGLWGTEYNMVQKITSEVN